MTHSLGDSREQSIVEGAASIRKSIDLAEVGVQRVCTADRRWEQITLGRFSRQHHVKVVHSKPLMDTVRTHISNRGRQIICDLLLYIKVPLHDIIPMWMRFDVVGYKRCWYGIRWQGP